MLKDSGTRREFSSGAVRDCAEGKGRCDLLPLDVITLFYNDTFLEYIDSFIENGKETALIKAIEAFIACWYKNDVPTALLDVALQYEEGAKKYDDDNWRKGIPLHCYIDSGIRHYLKFLRKDDDEPHGRACLWNCLGALWTLKHRPDLSDLRFAKKDGNIYKAQEDSCCDNCS